MNHTHTKCLRGLFLPVKPGVRAASFLAKLSEVKLESSFSGLMCTLKIEALPLISGGPAVERQTEAEAEEEAGEEAGAEAEDKWREKERKEGILYHPDEDDGKHLLRSPQEPQCLQNSSRCTFATSRTLPLSSRTLSLRFPCPEQECSTEPAALKWGKALCNER